MKVGSTPITQRPRDRVEEGMRKNSEPESVCDKFLCWCANRNIMNRKCRCLASRNQTRIFFFFSAFFFFFSFLLRLWFKHPCPVLSMALRVIQGKANMGRSESTVYMFTWIVCFLICFIFSFSFRLFLIFLFWKLFWTLLYSSSVFLFYFS